MKEYYISGLMNFLKHADDLADRIKRETAAWRERIAAEGNAPYIEDYRVEAVQNIVHDLVWGLANLNIEGAIKNAFGLGKEES